MDAELQEELSRRIRDQANHIEALTTSLENANRQNVQLMAQLKSVRDSAETHLRRSAALIDTLCKRINIMADTWQVQIRQNFRGSKGEIEKLIAEVEPFRPA